MVAAMRNTRKIVTHSSKAHRDEYLACCCAVWDEYRRGNLSVIERRVPGSSDLENPDTWVIDTGGRWEPELKNFDHHQPNPALATVCALDLVLKHLLDASAYVTYRTVSPWLRLTATHDTGGAAAAAAEAGMDIRAYMSTRSPIERATLLRFGELTVIHPESPIMCCMRETGRMLMNEAASVTTEVPEALTSAPAPFLHCGLRVWDIRSVRLDDSTAARAMVNQASAAKGVDVVVSFNVNTGAVGLYRQAWATPRMDLCQIASLDGVRFAHKNGFYAVIDGDLTDTQVMRLLAASAVAGHPGRPSSVGGVPHEVASAESDAGCSD